MVANERAKISIAQGGNVMIKRWIALTGLILFVVFSVKVNATPLQVIGTANYYGQEYNLIYEEAQELVWLDYTQSNVNWYTSVSWAEGVGNYLTINLNPLYSTDIDWSTGWRLPETDESKANLSGSYGWAGPDDEGYHDYLYGYNMVNSEMGHLFYISLGNLAYRAKDGTHYQPGWGLNNTGPFENLLDEVAYWSGTEYSVKPNLGWAWLFASNHGGQSPDSKNLLSPIYSGISVRPGSVTMASQPIPEPSTVVLLTIGLSGLGIFVYRRKHNTSA
jgi:hypothetical protein